MSSNPQDQEPLDNAVRALRAAIQHINNHAIVSPKAASLYRAYEMLLTEGERRGFLQSEVPELPARAVAVHKYPGDRASISAPVLGLVGHTPGGITIKTAVRHDPVYLNAARDPGHDYPRAVTQEKL